MTDEIQVPLQNPIVTPGGARVTSVTLRAYNAADTARARASIINNRNYGPACANDPVILNMSLLAICVVPPMNVPDFPRNWAEQLRGGDFALAVDSHDAISSNFETVEAYRADVARRIREAQAASASEPFQSDERVALPGAAGPE